MLPQEQRRRGERQVTFTRFPEQTLSFLRALRANNTTEWFRAHARDYESFCLAPAKEFVKAAGPEIQSFIPGIRAEPRVLGSIFRINRDVRFARDQPYKDHLDFWFWEGERKAAVSGLFARVSPDSLGIGAGCHGFDKERLAVFRQAVGDPQAGKLLDQAAGSLESKGYTLQGKALKRVPKGYAENGAASRFLLFNALYVHVDLPAETATRDGAMLSACLKHWRELAPQHRWITEHVQRQ
jgi:uncharacterized protein (TIGR02453 family)